MRRLLVAAAKVVGVISLLAAAAVIADYLRHQARFAARN